MHPRYQGANGVDDPQAALPGLLEILRRRPVGRKDHQGSRRHFGHRFHRDGPLPFQIVHHIGIVDNLMFDIDRRPEPLQALLHHLNGPHHPGAEPPRRTQNYLHFPFLINMDRQDRQDFISAGKDFPGKERILSNRYKKSC